jgi:hypothetical protein
VLVLAFALPVTDDADLAAHGSGWSADSGDDSPQPLLGPLPAAAVVALALVVVGVTSTPTRRPRPLVPARRTRLRAPPSPLGS